MLNMALKNTALNLIDHCIGQTIVIDHLISPDIAKMFSYCSTVLRERNALLPDPDMIYFGNFAGVEYLTNIMSGPIPKPIVISRPLPASAKWLQIASQLCQIISQMLILDIFHANRPISWLVQNIWNLLCYFNIPNMYCQLKIHCCGRVNVCVTRTMCILCWIFVSTIFGLNLELKTFWDQLREDLASLVLSNHF